MDIKKKINLVKKNFYLAIFVVVLLFAIGFVIAAYDATKASHETLYADRIEPKTGLDIVLSPLGNIGIGVDTPSAKLDVAGDIRSNGKLVCLVNGTNCPVSAQGKWDGNKPGDIYYNDGNVGIGTTTPSEKLEVSGNIRASGNINASGTICDGNGTCLGGTLPLKFEVYNSDTTTYACVEKDLKEYCGDEDGCTIRLLLQHETDGSDQVHIIDEHIYMEQTSLSNNNGAGIYGWTRQSGGGDYSWITGTSNRYEIFSPWDWVWAHNYRHDYCPGQTGNGPAFSNPYNFNFMSHPNVRTTIIVYDSLG